MRALTRKDATRTSSTMPSRQPAVRPPRKVLVVDDNDDVRESFVMLLMMHGYKASGASSGFGALRRLRDGLRPAVVVLDLRLPGMHGWEVLDHMRDDPALASIPVVMVSGDVHEAHRAEEHGLQNFLRKPVDPEVLLQAIERQCEK
jgi:two-component system, chemotaxis family, chemotaxis protein CheY